MTTIGRSGAPLFGFLRVRGPDRSLRPQPSTGPVDDGADLRAFLRSVTTLGSRLDRIERVVGSSRSGSAGQAASVASAASLDLTLETTSASLGSTEEVNTVATSYGPSRPSFSGGSSASPTLTGIYTGADDDTYTFSANTAGIVGTSPLSFDVRDGGGGLIETVSFSAFTPPGTEVTTGFGLSLSLSSGLIELGDSFQVTVSASVGTAVDPDGAFDQAGDEGANFDPGENVVAGSFEVNGVTVNVAADDTINGVLAKIEQSAAGVTASFDAQSETVELVSATPGAAGQVTVGNDTSGFLQAVKLSGATATAGTDDERTSLLSQVSPFASVVAGTFEVNGTSISVDPATDSLADVLSRIGGAGATAEYDADSGAVVISAADASAPLTLANDSSGFLQAAGLSEGVTEAEITRQAASVSGTNLSKAVDEFARTFRDIFTESASSGVRIQQIRLRSELRRELRDVFTEAGIAVGRNGVFDTGIGIRFELGADAEEPVVIDRQRLRESASAGDSTLIDLFGSNGRSDSSLIHVLSSIVDRSLQRVRDSGAGSIVDLFA